MPVTLLAVGDVMTSVRTRGTDDVPPSKVNGSIGEASRPRHRKHEADGLAEHVDAVFRAACALCGSPTDAEDLVRQVYARATSGRHRFFHRDGQLGYLMRMLRDVWIDTSRSRPPPQPNADNGLDGVDFVPTGAGDPELLLRTRAAYAAIGQLSEPLRETIVAVDILGLSYKDAGRSLRTSEDTVVSRLFDAREQVAAAMGGQS
jgi:RNA polymerase sigma-70 factor (ECF subfamily)